MEITTEQLSDIKNSTSDDELFGIWKDREDIGDVEKSVQNMRKGRKL